MYCMLCCKEDPAGSFVTACTNFKLEALRANEISKSHGKHSLALKAEQATVGNSEAEKTIQSLDRNVFHRMCHLFHNAHVLSEHSQPFTQNGVTLVTGGEDAVVHCYRLEHSGRPSSDVPQMTLETKGGPILAMTIHDVTKFYHNDLLVGDSLGTLTVICNQQILSHQTVSSSSINSLQVYKDGVGMSSVIVSNDTGMVAAALPETSQWKISLNSLTSLPVVTSLLTAELTDHNGHTCCYVLVADNTDHLYVINQGMVVMVISVPATVTAMCEGRFVSTNKLDLPPPGKDAATPQSNQCHQVALGTETGAIYLLHNFTITLDEFANAQSPVTNLATIPRSDPDKDLLLCCGHFNQLNVYQDGQPMTKFTTPDWISTVAVADIDNDGIPEAVIGCLDNSIHAIKVVS